MKSYRKIMLAIALLVVMASCNDDEANISQDNNLLFSEMQAALGGASNVANATAIQYQSVGVAFEFQEDPEPVGGKVADFNYSLLYNLDGTQSKQDWSVRAEYAYQRPKV